jgi:hypothetical protein
VKRQHLPVDRYTTKEAADMRIFVIEAYGGKGLTNGPIAHFTVSAESLGEALDLLRQSNADRFARFDVVQEGEEFEGEERRILEQGSGAYPKPV